MKLGNLLLAGTAAALTYWTVTNKDKIIDQVQETSDLLEDISNDYSNIQEQLAVIQGYNQPLKEMSQDLLYKFKVYQKEAEGHLEQIHRVAEKHDLPNQIQLIKEKYNAR